MSQDSQDSLDWSEVTGKAWSLLLQDLPPLEEWTRAAKAFLRTKLACAWQARMQARSAW